LHHNRWFKFGLLMGPFVLMVLVVCMVVTLGWAAWPSVAEVGLGFYVTDVWDPVHDVYGGAVFIWGSLLTTGLAILLAAPVSFAIALFTGYYFCNGVLALVAQWVLDLLASVPSVIFGFWGLMVLVPMIRLMETHLGVPPYGVGLFSAAMVLAFMMMPLMASLLRDIMLTVPADLKEGALALGATSFEVVKHVVWPHTLPGMVSAIMLGVGRAIGETMAVTMVIGNANHWPTHLFDPSNTIASLIASDFGETSDPLVISHLIHLGLVLLLLSLVTGFLGRRLVRMTRA